MLDSIAARPFTVSSGRRWPLKKGPMMSTTAHVLARYFRKKSCRSWVERCQGSKVLQRAQLSTPHAWRYLNTLIPRFNGTNAGSCCLAHSAHNVGIAFQGRTCDHLHNAVAQLGAQRAHAVAHELQEAGGHAGALLHDAAEKRHRLRILPQPRMHLPKLACIACNKFGHEAKLKPGTGRVA